LKSNPDSLDYVDPKDEFVFNVTQRELIGRGRLPCARDFLSEIQ
jgi:hypothetical protein